MRLGIVDVNTTLMRIAKPIASYKPNPTNPNETEQQVVRLEPAKRLKKLGVKEPKSRLSYCAQNVEMAR
jgi:hypothetical protein